MLPELNHDCRVYASLGLIYAVKGEDEEAEWRLSLTGGYVETLQFLHASCMVHAWLPKQSL